MSSNQIKKEDLANSGQEASSSILAETQYGTLEGFVKDEKCDTFKNL